MREIFNAVFFNAYSSASPVLSKIRVRPLKEGDKCSFQDEQGNIRQFDFNKRSASAQHKLEEAVGMTLPAFIENARKLGADMGHQVMADVFGAVDKSTKETGNFVSMPAGRLNMDLLLDMWEKIELDFEPDGTPRRPSMVLGSEAFAQFQREAPEWEKNTEYHARLEEIIKRKREKFYEREAHRRLVD
jgi:hypothetical protein